MSVYTLISRKSTYIFCRPGESNRKIVFFAATGSKTASGQDNILFYRMPFSVSIEKTPLLSRYILISYLKCAHDHLESASLCKSGGDCISCAAYMDTLYQIFGWNSDFKYRVTGTLFQKENEAVYLFNMSDAEVFIKPYLMAGAAESDAPKDEIKPLSVSGTRVRAVPREWMSSFGNQYYLHQHIFPPVESQSENDWKIRLEGQLFETGEKIHGGGEMNAPFTIAVKALYQKGAAIFGEGFEL